MWQKRSLPANTSFLCHILPVVYSFYYDLFASLVLKTWHLIFFFLKLCYPQTLQFLYTLKNKLILSNYLISKLYCVFQVWEGLFLQPIHAQLYTLMCQYVYKKSIPSSHSNAFFYIWEMHWYYAMFISAYIYQYITLTDVGKEPHCDLTYTCSVHVLCCILSVISSGEAFHLITFSLTEKLIQPQNKLNLIAFKAVFVLHITNKLFF